jgi:hypothetical protein
MKRVLPILALLFLCGQAWAACSDAATITVGSGKDCATIQAAANVVTAGHTVVVYAGTYAEYVVPPTSGTVGNPITFKVNAGDTVNVNGFNLSNLSYVTVGGSGTTEGFVVCSTYTANYCFNVTKGSHLTVQRNTIGGTSSGGGGTDACVFNSSTTANDSSYTSVLNNTLAWCGPYGGVVAGKKNGAAPIELRGNHWRVEGNTASHVSEFASNVAGDHHVVRNNIWRDTDCAADFGTDDSGAGNLCHMDALEVDCAGVNTLPRYILFEGNQIINVQATPTGSNTRGRGVHGFLANAETCTGITNFIYRFNYASNPLFGQLILSSSPTALFDHIAEYNNTADTMGQENAYANAYVGGASAGATNARSKNSLYRNATRTTGSINGIYTDANTNPTFIGANDLFFNTSGSTFSASTICVLNSLTKCTGFILNQDPLLSGSNLLAGSPAIKAGTSLTTVAAGDTGSGTSLIVNDATFFQDGLGVTGVSADGICAGTTLAGASCVMTTAVNYATNTLTLASGISRSNADGVWLWKKSDSAIVATTAHAPNIGSALPPTASLSASSIAFADQAVGSTSAPSSITLTNTGGSPLTITNVALTTGTMFTLTSATSGTVAPGATFTISVTFTPASNILYNDTVTVTSDSTAATSFTVSGTGTGAPTVTCSIASNFGSIVPGQSATLTITTANADIGCTLSTDGGTPASVTCNGTVSKSPATGSHTHALVARGATGTCGGNAAFSVTVPPASVF